MSKNNQFKNLIFHIKSDDYFGTLATILNFLKQDIKNKEIKLNKEEILENAIKDLMYLQENYKIEKNE